MDNDDRPIITIDVEAYRLQAGISVNGLATASGIGRAALRMKLEHPGQFTIDQLNAVAVVLSIPAEAFAVAS